MPTTTTPASGNSVHRSILELSTLLRPDWDARLARIPAWHPRNEVDPAAAAAEAAQQQIDWESDENPYRKRYTDTQASYTQNQQELARLKTLEEDPQAYIEHGKTKGWVEIEDAQAAAAAPQQGDETQQQYVQRLEAAEARIAEHDARIAAENAAAGEDLFHQDLDKWAEAEGVQLSKSDHNAIFGLLMQAPDPTQEAAARQIFDAHVAQKKTDREALEAEIRESMRRPRAPHVPSSGGTDTGVVDYDNMTRAEVAAHMAEQIRAAR